jgi:hypothetical protein
MLKNKAIQSCLSILRAVAILFLTIGITERSCFMFNIVLRFTHYMCCLADFSEFDGF